MDCECPKCSYRGEKSSPTHTPAVKGKKVRHAKYSSSAHVATALETLINDGARVIAVTETDYHFTIFWEE